MSRTIAWSVHLLTASGAVFGLLALEALARQDARGAFVWMAVAMLVDSVDGALARAADVRRVLPRFDGALLDTVVDYLTYVVVPVWAIWRLELVPEPARLGIGGAILIASGYQFCRRDAKTADHFFRGFPSFWNVAVFYLFFLGWSPWLNTALLATLCVGALLPTKWAYPSRMERLRALTVAVTLLWSGSVAVILVQYPDPAAWLLYGSLAYVLFYAAVSRWALRLTAAASGSTAR